MGFSCAAIALRIVADGFSIGEYPQWGMAQFWPCRTRHAPLLKSQTGVAYKQLHNSISNDRYLSTSSQ
ncbi:MAG: hypothetical protein AAGJ55_13370, partial [Cyanobacteria bacterium J06555_12]